MRLIKISFYSIFLLYFTSSSLFSLNKSIKEYEITCKLAHILRTRLINGSEKDSMKNYLMTTHEYNQVLDYNGKKLVKEAIASILECYNLDLDNLPAFPANIQTGATLNNGMKSIIKLCQYYQFNECTSIENFDDFFNVIIKLDEQGKIYWEEKSRNEESVIYNKTKNENNNEITNIYSQNSSGTVIDIDGNIYKTIKIGNQWWMSENLKVTHYRNGDLIPNVTNNSEWFKSTDAYCVYHNNQTYADTYGYLYNWYAVNDSRNIAPDDWHVPTDDDWKQLEIFLGMSRSEVDDDEFRGTNEGSKMAGNAALWNDGDLEYNDALGKSGFSALPGGSRHHLGSYDPMGHSAYFWSSSENSSSTIWLRKLRYTHSGVYRLRLNLNYSYRKLEGYSVRCVKNWETKITINSNDLKNLKIRLVYHHSRRNDTKLLAERFKKYGAQVDEKYIVSDYPERKGMLYYNKGLIEKAKIVKSLCQKIEKLNIEQSDKKYEMDIIIWLNKR